MLARHAPTGQSATWRIKGLGGVTSGAPGYAHRLLFIDITHRGGGSGAESDLTGKVPDAKTRKPTDEFPGHSLCEWAM